jgi:hypothetical protein
MNVDDLVKLARSITWAVHNELVPANRSLLRMAGLDDAAVDAALYDDDLETDAAVGRMCRTIRANFPNGL